MRWIVPFVSLAWITAVGAQSLEPQGSDGSVHVYTNCNRYIPTQYVKPRSTSLTRYSGEKIYSFEETAHQTLPERWVPFTAWEPTLKQWVPSALQLSAVIASEARRVNLDPLIIEIIIKHESGFDPGATSKAGAGGLMQLMPATATQLGLSTTAGPAENVAAGTRYFAEQYRQFGDLPLALAAYNAGPQSVLDAGGIPDFGETQRYVHNICSEYLRRRRKRLS